MGMYVGVVVTIPYARTRARVRVATVGTNRSMGIAPICASPIEGLRPNHDGPI